MPCSTSCSEVREGRSPEVKKAKPRHVGIGPLVVCGLLILGCATVRHFGAYPSAPFLATEKSSEEPCWIAVRINQEPSKFYRISSSQTPQFVTKMTDWGVPFNSTNLAEISCNSTFIISQVDGKTLEIQQENLSATHRLALGVPLEISRMTRADWEILPGVGPRLAARIDLYRQKNGDFSRLDELLRVRGVGKKRIASWRKFFTTPKSIEK